MHFPININTYRFIDINIFIITNVISRKKPSVGEPEDLALGRKGNKLTDDTFNKKALRFTFKPKAFIIPEVNGPHSPLLL